MKNFKDYSEQELRNIITNDKKLEFIIEQSILNFNRFDLDLSTKEKDKPFEMPPVNYKIEYKDYVDLFVKTYFFVYERKGKMFFSKIDDQSCKISIIMN